MYFDPIVGSLVFQGVLGGVLAGVFVFGLFRRKIARFFRRVFSKLEHRGEIIGEDR